MLENALDVEDTRNRVAQQSSRIADSARVMVKQEDVFASVTVAMVANARGIAPLSGGVMRHA